jgi:CBS domain-containing protein
MRVGGVMTLHPPAVTLDTPLREAIQLLAQTGKHGPSVMENGELVRVLSEARALQATAAALSEVEQYTALKRG